jgi:hypothetical protein
MYCLILAGGLSHDKRYWIEVRKKWQKILDSTGYIWLTGPRRIGYRLLTAGDPKKKPLGGLCTDVAVMDRTGGVGGVVHGDLNRMTRPFNSIPEV